MAETKAVAGQRLLPLIDHLARLGRRAAGVGISGCLRPRHLIALKLLGDHGAMAQHALGEALSLDPSNVVGLLNELEERGLITRRRDPADRRRHIVSLSDQGENELALSDSQFRAIEDDLLRALTPEERATLYDLLVRAVNGVTARPCVDGAAEDGSCVEPDRCLPGDSEAEQPAKPSWQTFARKYGRMPHILRVAGQLVGQGLRKPHGLTA